MAGRRTGLFGASEDERESRQNQQRDYAAQLQEQVRLKNARAEEDKSRRLQEQKIERDLIDARAQQQQPSRRGQQQQQLPPPVSPQRPPPVITGNPNAHQQQAGSPTTRSPRHTQYPPPQHQYQYQYQQQQQQQEQEIHHASAILPSGSPPKHAFLPPTWSQPMTSILPSDANFGGYSNQQLSMNAGSSPLVTGPSIFDTLLQTDTRGIDNQIEALTSLRFEIEGMWKQRRLALQSMTTKPSFLLNLPPPASAGVPLSEEEKRQLDEEIDLSPRPEEEEQEMELPSSQIGSSTSCGLLGESILIPLARQSVAPSSPARLSTVVASPSPRTPTSAVHRRLAAAAAAAAEASAGTQATEPFVLRHDSELLHFDE